MAVEQLGGLSALVSSSVKRGGASYRIWWFCSLKYFRTVPVSLVSYGHWYFNDNMALLNMYTLNMLLHFYFNNPERGDVIPIL